MNDKEFLQWIHDRLIEVHCENPNADFMYKLRLVIEETSEEPLVAIGMNAPTIESVGD